MKMQFKALMVYFIVLFGSLVLSTYFYGHSANSYVYVFPTAALAFYLYVRSNSPKNAILKTIIMLLTLYTIQFILGLWLNKVYISYAEYYDVGWKYTRDKILIRYHIFPFGPWLAGMIIGLGLGYLKKNEDI